ncbi:S9 family peptidase [Undibacterium cyanobacteriorum]|uniref:S9 family peptidase n=1 Tax=Undibacterium cyanobacteriorum TaxID=3073561 RepID=A0ABY9RI81_9BURK|nr:S9 family peptidase [Undibacterium sp. 20NA77.5]WMW80928.1 S9 family peptidase [Undibacterium sp. 20NA77.5]
MNLNYAKTKQTLRQFTLLAIFAASILQTGIAQAQTTQTTQRVMTPQDLWDIKRVDNPAISPDQKWIAFTLQTWSLEKNRAQTNIWIMDTQGRNARRLTTAEANDSAPIWSPDGHRIAFTSRRSDDEAAALYILRLDGGEAEKVLELPFGVINPKWHPNGNSLVLGTRAIPALKGEWKLEDLQAQRKEMKYRRESKMTAKVTEDRRYRFFDQWLTDNLSAHLLQFDLNQKTIKDLTPQSVDLFSSSNTFEFSIAPDGQSLVYSRNTIAAPHSESDNLDLIWIKLDDPSAAQNITADHRGGDSNPRFSADGKNIFYSRLNTHLYDGSSAKLWRYEMASGKSFPVTEARDYAVAEFEQAKDQSKLWMIAEDRGETTIFSSKVDGSQFEAVLRGAALSKLSQVGNQLIFLRNSFDQPNEIYTFDLSAKTLKQLSHFNDALMGKIKFGKVESYQFKGANDTLVQGWLIYPPDYDKNKTYPLLQLMHGGPHTMVGNAFSFRWNAHVMAAPGYVVTWVNRHGSTGFGEKFARSINFEWGVKPTQDILRSTDFLIEKVGNIDPKRVAAAGASYGGFLAAWLAGHTDRFATIIDHAGVNDVVAQYGSDQTNYSFETTMGGNPWSNTEIMQKNNPMSYAKNFKTPMLLTHGELDYRVPYVNSTALYGVLQSMKVPSRLVIFPNENHWILSPQNSVYWNWEVQSWLQRYIGGTPSLTQPRF